MDRELSHLRAFYGQTSASPSSTARDRLATTQVPNFSLGPFTDGPESPSRQGSATADTNPFASPLASLPPSTFDLGSAVGSGRFEERAQRYFHSRRVRKGEVDQPWLGKRDPKEKWVTILPLIGIFIGMCVSGFLVWDGIHSVVTHKYCIVLDEDWSNGLDPKIWQQEVQVGGFGNGEFDQTTADGTNVYIENGALVIKATLQDASLVESDSEINLSADGTCTATTDSACIAVTNTTTGNATIVPPAKSGRINTRPGAAITYGRVEVTAKLPQGDWLWPAIWMLPVNNTYGPWPQSGEIDLAESRGNNHTYPQGGNNIMSSALHWGPDPANDAWWRTNAKRSALHTTYSAGFNTFGIEWSEKYLFTYVNSRLLQVIYTNFDEPMWQQGNFPVMTTNGTQITNSWSQTGRPNTPFDQPFYLILNLAVGGTNGYFQDNTGGKPWLDGSPNARKDFWQSQDQWYPTWTSPQLEVSRVRMWQQCDGNEDL